MFITVYGERAKRPGRSDTKQACTCCGSPPPKIPSRNVFGGRTVSISMRQTMLRRVSLLHSALGRLNGGKFSRISSSDEVCINCMEKLLYEIARRWK